MKVSFQEHLWKQVFLLKDGKTSGCELVSEPTGRFGLHLQNANTQLIGAPV